MTDQFEYEPTADDIWDWAKENADTIIFAIMYDTSPFADDAFRFIREVYNREME